MCVCVYYTNTHTHIYNLVILCCSRLRLFPFALRILHMVQQTLTFLVPISISAFFPNTTLLLLFVYGFKNILYTLLKKGGGLLYIWDLCYTVPTTTLQMDPLLCSFKTMEDPQKNKNRLISSNSTSQNISKWNTKTLTQITDYLQQPKHGNNLSAHQWANG